MSCEAWECRTVGANNNIVRLIESGVILFVSGRRGGGGGVDINEHDLLAIVASQPDNRRTVNDG